MQDEERGLSSKELNLTSKEKRTFDAQNMIALKLLRSIQRSAPTRVDAEAPQ